MADIKKYELTEVSRPTAPFYLQVTQDEAVHMNTLKLWRPFLQIEVMNSGVMRVARLKLAAKSIWMDEQIEAGIPANTPFTQQERDAVKFVNGVLFTNLDIVQKYLDTIPQNEAFTDDRLEYQPYFRAVDEKAKVKAYNSGWKQKQKAAAKIAEMDLEDAQEMLLLLNGVAFTPPDDLDECQNLLVNYLDDVEGGAEDILAEEISKESQINLLINKAVFKNHISFTQVANEVVMRKGKQWSKIRTSDSTLDPEERQRQFAEYLLTDQAAPIREELQKLTEKAKPIEVEKPLV